ncbi:MAG: LPXTG cell wall anchor domain-containing protein [Draconibacterium sp.]|nr:LPXTG cell wall anchor domain-containing protein [Draconibacterium sp.]
MKTVKRFFALLMLNILSLPYILMAQDGGTYIDNMDVQDSSYMEQDLLAGAEQSGSNSTVIIVVVVIVVVVVAVFLFLKKKKE